MATTAVMAAEHHLPHDDQTPLSLELVTFDMFFVLLFWILISCNLGKNGKLLFGNILY